MPDIIDEKVKISELDSIPSNWGSQVIKAFLTQKGLLAVADSEGLAGTMPDTYKVSMQELVDALGLSDISEAVTIALGLKQGSLSVAFVDSDKSSVTALDDGKTLRYSFSSINQALATNATIIVVVGSNTKTEVITSAVNAKLIINLNTKLTIEVQNNVQVNNSLAIVSKGSVILGTLNYASGVNFINVEAYDINVTSSNVKTILKAENAIVFHTISSDSDLKAKTVSINSINNVNVDIETTSLTFVEANSIQGDVNAKASVLRTYPLNVIGGSIQLDLGKIILVEEGHVWLSVNSTNGATVSAFVKVKPSFYDASTDYKGYVVNHSNETVNVTYAGVFPISKVVGGSNINVTSATVGDETTYTVSGSGNSTIIDTTYTLQQVRDLVESGANPILRRVVSINNTSYEFLLPYSGYSLDSYVFGNSYKLADKYYYFSSSISSVGWTNDSILSITKNDIATSYVPNTEYKAGAIVWNDDVLYVAEVDNEDPSFNIEHWTQAPTICDLISSKVDEAPEDDISYVRKNGEWIQIGNGLDDVITYIEL